MTPLLRLLVIDPQNDFCDLPLPARPALPVPGANADLVRLGGFIAQVSERLERLAITLDTHRRLDVAHPGFWRQGDGSPVQPFTEITAAAVRRGAFRPRRSADEERVLDYLDDLEAKGRYRLMVWPVHCEVGTWGHNVHDAVQASAHRWEEQTGTNVDYFYKGQNPWTEHYSAVMAEVPDASDPQTQLNQDLLEWVHAAGCLIIAGEASSHCVRATVEHLIQNPPPKHPAAPRRWILLSDCMSPVVGFEDAAKQFLQDAQAAGLQLMTSAQAAKALTEGA